MSNRGLLSGHPPSSSEINAWYRETVGAENTRSLSSERPMRIRPPCLSRFANGSTLDVRGVSGSTLADGLACG